MNLNTRLIESQTNTSSKDVFLRDSSLRGFGVRISPNNVKSFFVEARIRHEGSNNAKRIVLGRYPDLSLKAAKESAAEWLTKMRQGDDPARAIKIKNRNAKIEDEANITFGELFERFMESRQSKHMPNTVRDYRSAVKNHLQDWIKTPIKDIDRRDMTKCFNRISEQSGKAQANKTIRILNVIFNFAKGTIHVDGKPLIDNPVEVIKDAGLRHREVRRERYIEPNQLEAFVKAVIKLGDHPVRDYLFLVLLTGLRIEEALSLKWENVDFMERTFTIIEEKAKNHERHVVPMSSLVFRLFVSRRRKNIEDSIYVFPSARGNGHFKEPRPQINKVKEYSGIEFSSHDLRRTYASILNEVVGNEGVIKRLLNHKTKNITQRYIQTRAEQFRPCVEAVESYIVIGHDWNDLESIKGYDKQYAYPEALEKLLYWSPEEIANYDISGGSPSLDITLLFKDTPKDDFIKPVKKAKEKVMSKSNPLIEAIEISDIELESIKQKEKSINAIYKEVNT